MSHPGDYQYQSYVDPNNSLKSERVPIVNGQSTVNQHIQNGMQSPHSNLTGTPSSQSSRDPSRETSRDPSPTQYLHNQYRPQLPRPPMPPINGQQNMHLNVRPPLPTITQTQQCNPATIPYPHNQFNSSATNIAPLNNTGNASSAFVSLSSNVQGSQDVNSHNMPSITQVSPTNSSHNTLSESDGKKGTANFPSTESTIIERTSTSQTTGLLSDTSYVPAIFENFDNASQKPSIMQNPSGHSLGQSSMNVSSFNQSGRNESLNIPTTTQNQDVMPQLINPSHSPQMMNQRNPNSTVLRNTSQNVNSERQPVNFASPQNLQSYLSQPKYGSQQNIFNSPQNVQGNTQNVPSFAHNSSASMQNLFVKQQQTQHTLYSPNMSGSRNITGAQDNLPPQSRVQSLHSLQSTVQNQTFGSHADLLGQGSTSQPSHNMYGSQPNLTSQRNYAQNYYGTQMPPSTANISSSVMTPPRFSEPSNNPGLSSIRQPITMPPPAGQHLGKYDVQPPYPGQLSNIPLDPMSVRYPGSYPDQMNQLNRQMNTMSVTQAGYNKIWGMESIDLLQTRNILPPEKVEPPKVRLHQEFLDSVNCSPDIFRCTLTKIPETNSLLQKSRLPLGILIHPFKDLNQLPVIQCSTIVRCRICRTYINPFVYFVDSKRWKCNLCYRVNDLPGEFQFDPVTQSFGDPSRRPEVKTSTIEFIAPSEYMLRPPQPAVYLFILDVSRLAVESGYLTVVCNTITDELSRLPGDGRTQIGFLAVDSTIHFFSMPDNVSQPHEMIMLDVDDVFLPCPDNLIVNLKEREELVKDLLAQLPTKFQGTHDTNSALGAALQAAYKLMSPTGGRMTVFQTCLPNMGPGALQSREDPNVRASKDVPHLNPATDFYKRLALDCSGQQIAVDLFLLNSQYSDLATLSGMCKFSGGCIFHLPLFRSSKLQHMESLERILRRYLTRKIGFEAVMRIRCTRGLSIHTFHGNFFVRSTDLLSLPNVNPDAGFGMQISIEESLAETQNVCFQAALLYTSSKGERRIRVHTLCLPVVSSLTDILHSADQQCIIGLLSKMAVDRSQQSSLSDARDALINVAIDVLSAYKLSQSVGSGGLLAPSSLKLLPLYIIALLKCIAFRSGTSTRLDDRVFAMCQLKTLPILQLIQMVYPDLYPVHVLDDKNSMDIDGKVCPQPPRLHLSAEKIDSRGAFLMDAGDKIFIYVGKNIHSLFCCNVLGVSAFSAIPEEFYELPELDTIENERLRHFVFSLQEEKPYYASVQIIRDDSHFRTLFVEQLVEDRFESALSYYEFLQHLKTQVK
ncbi:protein transport protein Sec24A [Vespa crabro]|uniref:protein transport protein Sec24A n=1 Tax=Vespa crabro TaxID=7445 RepID=UPI001F008189|nr:protein transport protein Sec24A [Vespa crabro]XP_046813507.1 protein transport protein Sec24A [Vespa crabro]